MERKDADFPTLSAAIREIDDRIRLNYAQGKKKTLVFVYYAGHGVQQNFTKVVCDVASKPVKVMYPLEKQLRTLGTHGGSYVIGVFDCCRASFTAPNRGVGPIGGADELEDEEDAGRNCILTFGCPPNGGVSAVSTIATEYLQKFMQCGDSQG